MAGSWSLPLTQMRALYFSTSELGLVSTSVAAVFFFFSARGGASPLKLWVYRLSVVKCSPPVYRTPFARGGSMYPLEVYPPLGGLVVPLA